MKNFIVISKPVIGEEKGVIKYLSYLVSTGHSNHVDKTRIVPIHNSIKKFINNNIFQIIERKLKRKKARLGGRDITSFAQSFVLSLPPDIKVDDETWRDIAMDIFSDLACFIGVSKSILAKNCFINLHDQDNQHLNIVISKVVDGHVCRDLQRKSVISFIKASFNSAVLKHAHVDYKSYKPKTSRAKRYNSYYFKDNEEVINVLHSNYSEKIDKIECDNNKLKVPIKKWKRKFV